MAHVINEIEVTPGERAQIMSDIVKGERPGPNLRVRLVFKGWSVTMRKGGAQSIPQVVAEYSEHVDALGKPIWQSADKLPLPLVLAAIGSLAQCREGVLDFVPNLGGASIAEEVL